MVDKEMKKSQERSSTRQSDSGSRGFQQSLRGKAQPARDHDVDHTDCLYFQHIGAGVGSFPAKRHPAFPTARRSGPNTRSPIRASVSQMSLRTA